MVVFPARSRFVVVTRLANNARMQNTMWAGFPNLAYTICNDILANKGKNTIWAGFPNLAYTICNDTLANKAKILYGQASQTSHTQSVMTHWQIRQNTIWAGFPNLAYTICNDTLANKARILYGQASQTSHTQSVMTHWQIRQKFYMGRLPKPRIHNL